MSLTDWEVVIPETVTRIKDSAFWASGIAKVNIPYGVTVIESSAFYNNRITELNIPSTVTSIGVLAFNTNHVQDESQAWIYKRTESGIDYSTLIGYAGVNKKNLVIPPVMNGVELTTLGNGALRYLYLTGDLVIPSTVKHYGELVFAYNNLTNIDNGDGKLVPGFVYARKADGTIDYEKIYGYGSSSTANVVIPNNVKEIGDNAFYYSNIKGVTLPEGLLKIGDNAFLLCKLGPEIVIPSTVTNIGTNAFKKEITYDNYNSSLTKIVNKTGKKFDWKAITGGPTEATFEYGTVENWYGNIEVVKG